MARHRRMKKAAIEAAPPPVKFTETFTGRKIGNVNPDPLGYQTLRERICSDGTNMLSKQLRIRHAERSGDARLGRRQAMLPQDPIMGYSSVEEETWWEMYYARLRHVAESEIKAEGNTSRK